ncbi:uncharacterized protein F4807DRAFT_460788 [Annulohypoxylon truncatum]|uniref:uncharacterized protein n=1 Tax=Annulohypoxylon truncatum TaxID=327061 RepID=UPI0020088715|nr:uncharacterized protein F4807DRAFT_460788 [Annulohypoxylon truncatum]KAI1209570.1 hypothetical protein F4807DRAFT_460788 [Annulohypoxylon truncatum]
MATKERVTKYRVDETNKTIEEYKIILRGIGDDPNILTSYDENMARRIRDWASNTHEEFSPAEDAAPDDDEYTTAVTDALRGLGDLIDTGNEILNKNENKMWEYESELMNSKKEECEKKKKEEEKKKQEEEEEKKKKEQEEEKKREKRSCCS